MVIKHLVTDLRIKNWMSLKNVTQGQEKVFIYLYIYFTGDYDYLLKNKALI